MSAYDPKQTLVLALHMSSDPLRTKPVRKLATQRTPYLILPNPLCCPLAMGRRMQSDPLRRRQFIAGMGALASWPMIARAQQLRRIGVLMSWDESDPVIKAFLSGFMQGLAELGWTDGGNVRMEVRWAGGNVDRLRMFAKELVDLQSD